MTKEKDSVLFGFHVGEHGFDKDKILDELKVKYSANILAAIVAVILTAGASVGYIIYASIEVTPQVIVTIVAMIFLAFLCATVGYDKVVQAIEQLKKLAKIE